MHLIMQTSKVKFEETKERGYSMSENLTCRFCGIEFKKGWDSKLSKTGWDSLIIHMRREHMGEWAKIRFYSKSTTLEKEKGLAKNTDTKVINWDY